LVQQLGAQGKRPNWEEISAMICTATNQPPKSLFVPMSPEEQQAWQQQQQSNAEAIHMQMQRERIAAQQENQHDSDETKLLLLLLKQIITPDVAHKFLNMKPAELIAAESQPPKPATSGGGSK